MLPRGTFDIVRALCLGREHSVVVADERRTTVADQLASTCFVASHVFADIQLLCRALSSCILRFLKKSRWLVLHSFLARLSLMNAQSHRCMHPKMILGFFKDTHREWLRSALPLHCGYVAAATCCTGFLLLPCLVILSCVFAPLLLTITIDHVDAE